MPPFAICSNEECSYGADLKEEGRWEPHLLAVWCPVCKCRVVFHCPVCYSPLHEPPGPHKPECGTCKTPFRPEGTEAKRRSGITLVSV